MITDRLTLVFAVDEGYVMPLATALRSAVESNRDDWPLDVYVLTSGVSENSQRKVIDSLPGGSASIQWVPVNLNPFRQFSTPVHISETTYARLLAYHVLPRSINRVLYLDADLLVLDSLRPLWQVDLGGKVLGAVSDRIDPQLKRGEPGLKDVPRVSHYFNAGVLIIDLDEWRRQRISERAKTYLTEHPCPLFCDQDALNVACDGLWKPLDSRWNYQDHLSMPVHALDAAARPAVVHFVSCFKPWNPSALSPHAQLYDSYRAHTCYARTRWERVRDAVHSALSRLKHSLVGDPNDLRFQHWFVRKPLSAVSLTAVSELKSPK